MLDYTRLIPNRMRALRRVLLPVARDWRAAHGQDLADKWVGVVSRCCTLAQSSQAEQLLRLLELRIQRLKASQETVDLHCAGELEDFADVIRDRFVV